MPLDHNDATADALAGAVKGRYTIEREIGRGGMGVVFLAVDERLQRRVAIKTLPPHLAADEAVRKRFLHEARTAAALTHSGIVPIYSASEESGVVYFVMRWIDGESLADKLAAKGPLPSGDVLALMTELATALGYAHAIGIVHRDIKAENVLIERKTGKALITDFGIARVIEMQTNTATGTILGTVQYMSPEQVVGETIDGRADLYALGVLGFHCLTGRFPFERPTPTAVLVAQVNDAAPRVSWYAPDVLPLAERVVSRLLQKQPNARFPSAELLCAAIQQGASDEQPRGIAAPSAGAAIRKQETAPLSTAARTPPAGLRMPGRLSSESAQVVWARAAELQAGSSATQNVPTSLPADTIATPDAKTVGYDVAVVRDAAREAGIDLGFVDRAIVEHARQRAITVVPSVSSSGEPPLLAGAHKIIDFEGTIDGELTQEGFEQLADEASRQIGEMVQAGVIGRTLTITTLGSSGSRGNSSRLLQVTVSSRNGTTNVRAVENLTPMRRNIFVAGLVSSGYAGGIIAALVAGNSPNPVLAIPVFLGLFGASFWATRLINIRRTAKRVTKLNELVSRLLLKASDNTG